MYEVTIAIPIYHVEAYIENTLHNALNQSFESIEFLMIDDCGKDNSLNLVQSIAKTHPRGKDIRIISHECNQGIACVRNSAIEQARGKYLYFLDGDDCISTDCIQLLYNYSTKYQTDFTAASFQTVSTNGHKSYFRYNEQFINGNDKLASLHFNKGNGVVYASMCNRLYNTEWLRNNHIRCTPGTIHEEPDFNFQLITHTKSCYLLPQVTYFYNQREGSATQKIRPSIPIQEIENHINSMNFRKQYAAGLKSRPYFPGVSLNLMKTSFNDALIYVSAKISPSFTNNHLKQVLQLPFDFKDILSFKYNRISILLHYPLFVLPVSIQRMLLLVAGKYKRTLWRWKRYFQS